MGEEERKEAERASTTIEEKRWESSWADGGGL